MQRAQDKVIAESGISLERILSMMRIAHVGSHSENVDGITKLSPVSIEESLNATDTVFELFRKLDSVHFERLSKLCKSD